jgi:BirA family biotin operon repressor/biotin-[acetyl-CoA-carboxylase] ligase
MRTVASASRTPVVILARMSWTDLDRPPLSAARLRRDLAENGFELQVVPRTASTNADLVAVAAAGAPEGTVLVAESQEAGRGRLGRTWTSPPRAGLTVSVLLRPELPAARWPWLPLWGGLAVARALREQAGVDAVLKWPNDVLIGGRKVCGLLAEVPAPGALVLGIGLNVSTREDELPHAGATSLALAGAGTTDRDTLLRALLRDLAGVLEEASPDGYRALCSTIGTDVRVELPGGQAVEGTATAVDDDGRLVVDGTAYGAGDVVHLRAG